MMKKYRKFIDVEGGGGGRGGDGSATTRSSGEILSLDKLFDWNWKIDIVKQQQPPIYILHNTTSLPTEMEEFLKINLLTPPMYGTLDPNEKMIMFGDSMNCTNTDYILNERSKLSPIIEMINLVSYITISIGIVFNLLNLIVLLKSKLNESPYTYLTMLAFSDLGAISMVGVEKVRQMIGDASGDTGYGHLYVATGINIFLSSSMYITLALTIERFIFVHSPFKAMSICRRSIARRVCLVMFIFSFLRSVYLPFMYTRNCYQGFDQKKNRILDIYEFLISLGIPYFIILIANLSLIRSLKKQNNIMTVSYSLSNNLSLLSNSCQGATGAGAGAGAPRHSSSLIETTNFRARFRNRMPRIRRFSTFNNVLEFEPILEKKNKSNNNITGVETGINTIEQTNNAKRSTISLQQNQQQQHDDPICDNVNMSNKPKTLRHSNTISTIFTSSPTSVHLASDQRSAPQSRTNSTSNNTTTTPTANTPTATGSQTSSSIYNNLKLSTLYRKTSNLREIKNQKKLTTTLIIILCLLLVCYLPSFIFEESLADHIFGSHEEPDSPETNKAIMIKSIGYRISILLIYINCSANFLIYCICNKKFKNSLKLLMKKSFVNTIYQRVNNFLHKYCLCLSVRKASENVALYNIHINLNRPHLAYCTHYRGSNDVNIANNNNNKNNNGSDGFNINDNDFDILHRQHQRLFGDRTNADETIKEVSFGRTNGGRKFGRNNSNSIQTSSLRTSELNFNMK